MIIYRTSYKTYYIKTLSSWICNEFDPLNLTCLWVTAHAQIYETSIHLPNSTLLKNLKFTKHCLLEINLAIVRGRTWINYSGTGHMNVSQHITFRKIYLLYTTNNFRAKTQTNKCMCLGFLMFGSWEYVNIVIFLFPSHVLCLYFCLLPIALYNVLKGTLICQKAPSRIELLVGYDSRWCGIITQYIG